jgi:hypothetical protein
MFLIIFGLLTVGGAALWFLFAAFEQNILWGLGCLFVPFVSLIFLIVHWKKAAQPFCISLLGVGIIVTGGVIRGATIPSIRRAFLGGAGPAITPHLDPATINAGSPADVADAAWTTVVDALEAAKGDHEAAVHRLPRPWRAVYTTYWLQCEVNNGGHHQFFWNSEGALNAETEEDIEFIGATSFLGLFREARRVFDAHDYRKEKRKAGKSWEGFTAGYREKRMAELDSAFYKMPKRLEQYLGEFIRAHPELYSK